MCRWTFLHHHHHHDHHLSERLVKQRLKGSFSVILKWFLIIILLFLSACGAEIIPQCSSSWSLPLLTFKVSVSTETSLFQRRSESEALQTDNRSRTERIGWSQLVSDASRHRWTSVFSFHLNYSSSQFKTVQWALYQTWSINTSSLPKQTHSYWIYSSDLSCSLCFIFPPNVSGFCFNC